MNVFFFSFNLFNLWTISFGCRPIFVQSSYIDDTHSSSCKDMDKMMAVKTYLKGCLLGGVTMAIIIILKDVSLFNVTSQEQTTSAFRSLIGLTQDNKENQQMNGISSSHESRPRIILSTTNSAFLDFTQNWLASMKHSGISDHVVIVAEDEGSFHTMNSSSFTNYPKLHVKMAAESNGRADALKFGSDGYLKFVNKRPDYILHFLQKGYDVLFSDVDIVLLDDPFPHFDDDVDIDLQVDVWKRDNHNHSDVFCAGFVFYHATEPTREFLKKLILRLSKEPHTPDQVLLNKILLEKEVRKSLRTRAMEGDLFVSGKYYFSETWRKVHAVNRKPVMIHNNWIKRTSDKRKRFTDLDLWFIDV